MRLSKIPAALAIAHQAKISVFIKSPPGTAKTALVRQYADAQGMPLLYVSCPLSDPIDLRGIPATYDDYARFLPLNFWPKETDPPVVVLLDEILQCPPAIQNCYAQLLIDHQMGDVKLPEGSFVAATSNRRQDRAATHNMPSHIVSRVMHIEIDAHHDDFINHVLKNNWPVEIYSFLNFKPDCIHNFDPEQSQDPYANYRSWEKVAHVLQTNPNEDLLPDLIAGLVGQGAATEFIAFRRLSQSLPNPKAVLKDPDAHRIPEQSSVLYAISASLAVNVDAKTVDNYFKYVRRLPTEFSVMSVKTARATYPGISKAKAFGAWAKENSAVLF